MFSDILEHLDVMISTRVEVFLWISFSLTNCRFIKRLERLM